MRSFGESAHVCKRSKERQAGPCFSLFDLRGGGDGGEVRGQRVGSRRGQAGGQSASREKGKRQGQGRKGKDGVYQFV